MEEHELRISDEDRHRVAEVLRQAAGEGRIDFAELDDRLEATYSAKTYGDLVPITADLPAAAHTPAPTAAVHRPTGTPEPGIGHQSSLAVMSQTRRSGVWTVGATHTAFAMMGNVTLDLRGARFTSHEVVVWAAAIMGDVKVVVNPGTEVVVDGLGIMGEFRESRSRAAPQLTPQSPVVRVKGLALMGSVHVQRRPMPGDTAKRLGRSGG